MKKKTKIKKNNFKTEVSKSFKQEKDLEKASLEFLSFGIACHALCLIEHANILKILLNKGKFRENQIKNFIGVPDSTFEVGERIFIGKEGRTKVLSVLGKMDYNRISTSSQSEMPSVVEKIISQNEKRFIQYLNNAQPLT
ncbi:hypothetical protein LCGC14_3064370, partial [marine sediment metagenome]